MPFGHFSLAQVKVIECMFKYHDDVPSMDLLLGPHTKPLLGSNFFPPPVPTFLVTGLVRVVAKGIVSDLLQAL